MGKKKRIATLTMCLVMSCASIGLVSACGGGDNPQPDPGPSPVVTVTYTVTFRSLGGTDVASQTVKEGEKATEPTAPTRAGYIFVEWQHNGKKYDFNSPITGNIELKAKWKEDITQFTVTFKNENETFKTEKINQGRKVTKPATDPTREGYAFDCWTLNNAEYDFNTPITADITLTAKWIKTYKVTFAVGEGTAVDPVWIKTGETVTAPTSTRAGYKLTDWLLNGVSYDFSTPVTADITLTAVWSEQPLASNQFGVNAFGWNMPSDAHPEYLDITEGANGEIAIAAKFAGSTTDYPSLVLRNLYDEDYYASMIAAGKTGLKFKLAIGGDNAADVSDLYVFGKKLSEFPVNAGVYTILIDLQYIVDNYATIGKIGMAVKAANAQLNQMLIAWKSTDWTARNYVFTISDVELFLFPTISLDFAAGDENAIRVGETTTLVATTNYAPSAVEWSSSSNAIATVAGGVITGNSLGTVTVSATVEGIKTSKTIFVYTGDILYSYQIGINAWGWNQTNSSTYIGYAEGASGETVVTAKFAGDKTAYPALVLRNLLDKSDYEYAIAHGNSGYKFNLTVGGANAADIDDLYIFGQKLTTFPVNAGVYTITVDLQHIVDNYDTIGVLGTQFKATNSYFNQMFIAWRSTTYTNRDYVFTISNEEFVNHSKAPLASSQLSAVTYGWDKIDHSDIISVTTNADDDIVVTANLVGTKSDYPAVVLRNLYDKSYYQGLIDEGYVKLTFGLNLGGTDASKVSDLYVFGTKLTDFGRTSETRYVVVVDLQYIVDNYDAILAVGTSTQATTDSLSKMLLAWKPTETEAATRNYVFTLTDPMFVKGVLFTNNIGLRVNGNNMLGSTSYLSVDNGDNGEIVINAKFNADATYYPTLTWRNLPAKSYFEDLVAAGYTTFTFNLKVSGADADKLSDIYILTTGRPINWFTQEANGGYRIEIELSKIVQFYDSMNTLATSWSKTGTTSTKSAMFISWRSPADDYTSVRNYTFTISGTGFSSDLV